MIARAASPQGRKRFRRACRQAERRGVPCLGLLLEAEQALFGRSQPGRFYAGPGLALDIGGAEALAVGGANPEELASFLALCGCRALVTDGPAPAGWHESGRLHAFALEPGRSLPRPPADEALWARLARTDEPPAGPLADFLYPGSPALRDDFYSALCTKRSRALARAAALTLGGQIVSTVGAYAIRGGQAYLACGCTAPALRGRGVGGRLIAAFAGELAAQGLRPVFLCEGERAAFYARLGFAPAGSLARCLPDQP